MNKPKRDEQQQEILSDPEDRNEIPLSNQPQAIVYGQNPVDMKCPYCLEIIKSQIILKPQIITVALGLCIFAIVPNFVMILLVVMLLQFASSRKHRCPLCERQLGSDGKFLIFFTDQVYSFSLFSAGFIFTKKTMVTVFLIGFAVSIITARSYYEDSNKFIATTWSQYLNECGSSEPVHCLNKYRSKQFKNWEGHLLKIEDNRQYEHKWYLHAVSLYMKMEPSLYQDQRPDTLITLNTDTLNENTQLVQKMKHGDKLRFNSTLHERERGTLKDVMHFHVFDLEIIGHNNSYAMYTTQIEEEWIKIHVQDKGKLRSQPEDLKNIKPI